MGTVMSVLITALMRVILSISTTEVAEQVVRRVLLFTMDKAVASTENTVDDEMTAPIRDALRGGLENGR